ncbi:hypothetical protein FQN57_007498 [Myotisia sp. PD_48]|nr:hypothetical protein FQN57_007498 [Myotisia sp. PD_48]
MPALRIQPPTPTLKQSAIDDNKQTQKHDVRRSHIGLDSFSPVNENGSFEFDRVLKRGKVLRRSKSKHAFKSSWKPGYLVLRPNLLSLYKDEDEARLQLSFTLSDISAVAPVKAPRSNRPNVFGVFSPAKNYRFQATSKEDANSWVERIRNECLVDYPDEILNLYDPTEKRRTQCLSGEESAGEVSDHEHRQAGQQHSSSFLLSAPEPTYIRKRRMTQEYSGNDITSCSDFSDNPDQTLAEPRCSSASHRTLPPRSSFAPSTNRDQAQSLQRIPSHQSDVESPHLDPERVIFHGYLQILRSKQHVRHWKKLWVVLRAEQLYFYKDDNEYLAVKIIPMSQVINAAEIDPLSRSKTFCFQIITEDVTYRLCAPSEESLNRWLGSLKSVLMRLRDTSKYPI